MELPTINCRALPINHSRKNCLFSFFKLFDLKIICILALPFFFSIGAYGHWDETNNAESQHMVLTSHAGNILTDQYVSISEIF